ncbi:hypothetical protein KL933_004157 [Ogataea haglerorum]|uniref:non-specific serine/threonine protein kinase n=1 Tax=Ogataea haglerorum TaxID=1937702 RepID=A0AAN6D2X0_9ASCO|nr:hypothetical protein KL915_004462 [Ogataea haglerorum]KAG7704332.1 hypothetical protein KL914_004319 [Ogataea haglerorum]KAG7725591.1 hypothetical protein KL933_004157 [Ogataea haglerorum]KAG7728379.1 hypothetical protein KL948_004246 [Ogataea haglerorum]KAG7738162.1 hypothetical protein KL932_003769 [Ogataea haglerorum]
MTAAPPRVVLHGDNPQVAAPDGNRLTRRHSCGSGRPDRWGNSTLVKYTPSWSPYTFPMKTLTNVILNNKYLFEKRVGSGSYGVVYSARHLFTGKMYAIKVILKNQSVHGNKKLLEQMEAQILDMALANGGALAANLLSLHMIEQNGTNCKILKEISLQLKVHKHPNILSLYKVYDLKPAIFVVMDYYPDGDLFNTIVEQQRYKNDPFLIKSVFLQLVDAITYCHSKNVYHCDIKPENILVADNGTRMILADFGLALQDHEIESNICCGSSYYMSPERIQNFCQGFDSKDAHSIHVERLLQPSSEGLRENVRFPTSAGDVWSLAIILINLVTIRNPWLRASLQDTTFKAFVKDPTVLQRILPISTELFHILCKYLRLNPWERGDLFEFRQDVLTCSRFADSGPLSVDSRIDPADQWRYSCQVPVDHVQLDKVRSRERAVPEEHETDHIIDLPLPTRRGLCGNCADCGYGARTPRRRAVFDGLLHSSASDEPYSSTENDNIRVMIYGVDSDASSVSSLSMASQIAVNGCSYANLQY